MAGRITPEMAARAYELGSKVWRGKLRKNDAVAELVAGTGINANSGSQLVSNLQHMLRGETYKRTMNYAVSKYFIEQIETEFGSAYVALAFSALKKHLDYWDEKKGAKHHLDLRQLLHSDDIMLVASDVRKPKRVQYVTSRVVRNTRWSNRVKMMHQCKCQICGETVLLADGSGYAEGHHIKPLGAPHNGTDEIGNILCLCPNHHAQCDFGAIKLHQSGLRAHPKHPVERRFIEYHNSTIYAGADQPTK